MSGYYALVLWIGSDASLELYKMWTAGTANDHIHGDGRALKAYNPIWVRFSAMRKTDQGLINTRSTFILTGRSW